VRLVGRAELAVELREADGDEDLDLAVERRRLPRLERRLGREVAELDARREVAGEPGRRGSRRARVSRGARGFVLAFDARRFPRAAPRGRMSGRGERAKGGGRSRSSRRWRASRRASV
jgi:hypothetical protein